MSLLARRFPTVLGLLFLVAAVVFAFYYFRGGEVQTSEEVVPDKVRITNIADNKFSVSWITNDPTYGAIEYGPVGEKLTTKVMDDRDVDEPGMYPTHHVTVEGLQPSTQYAFRIVSGEASTRFDNNGSPYTATTGAVIAATPPSQNFYGNVELAPQQAGEGAVVYVTLPGASTVSTLVNASGNYAITLSTMRSNDLRSYVSYDPAASIATVVVEGGMMQSTVSVSLVNMAPVPTITLGQDASFLTKEEIPSISEIDEAGDPPPDFELSPDLMAETPPVLNVEPLATEESINVVTETTLTILNPGVEGETLATLKPEFRGTGPAGTTVTIALTGQKAISDTVVIASDGTWSWAPVIDLRVGKQTVSVSYIATGGTEQEVSRSFNVSTTTITSDPAFVSSPSASTTATASLLPSSSPTPRAAMPATDSGVPVTGVIENTLLTAGLGIVIMIVGAILFVL